MKINLVIDSFSRANGGLFDAERRLHQTLFLRGVEAAVFGLHDAFSEADAPAWSPLKPVAFRTSGLNALGQSPGLCQALLAEPADLIYRAGLWRLPSLYSARWARKYQKPEIIAPHGMLDPWAVRNSYWKKQVARIFYEGSHLRGAHCLRALCEPEARAIRAFGLANPIAVIPNGMDVPDPGDLALLVQNVPWSNLLPPQSKVLLYLGRLHPKKGLVNLLRAWAALRASGWTLAIAGWDQGGHEAALKQLATGLNVVWADLRDQNPSSNGGAVNSELPSILFLGPQFGPNKAACYFHCQGFVLPSLSEGLPMVVLEAWAYAKPVLMTPECNLPVGFARGAAVCIEANVDRLAAGLREFFASSEAQRRALGERGLQLAREQFSWPVLAQEMKHVYEWMLGGSPKPACLVDF